MSPTPTLRRASSRRIGLMALGLLAASGVIGEEEGAGDRAAATSLAPADPALAEVDGWRRQLEELAFVNEELGRQNALLRDRLGDLRQQLEAEQRLSLEQRRREQRRWFVTGAAVLLAGLVLGLMLSRLRPRRRSRWGDL